MGEMTFKDAAERYGPAVALVVALVLLVTLLPGNNSSKGSQVSATGPSAGTAASGDSTAGAAGSTDASGAGAGGSAAVGTAGSGSSTGVAATGGSTTGGATKAATPGPSVPAVVPAQQGQFACRADGRQAGVSVAMPPCKQYDATKGNGGATGANGVTADSIKVAYYVPKADAGTQAALKAAGVADAQPDIDRIMEVYRRYWNWHAQTYGREVKFDTIYGAAATNDDVGMKADANKIGDAKYFAVIVAGGTTGSPTFDRTIAQRGVICIACTTSQASSFYQDTLGYNFGSLQTVREYYENLAEYIAKRLVGPNRTAQWAGTNVPDYKSQPRKFGIIWLQANQGTVDPGAQEERDYFFNTLLPKYGLPKDLFVDVAYNYDISAGPTTAQTVIAKLHQQNVTTIAQIADPLMPVFFTREATKEAYFPEWIETGTGLTDTTFFGRTYDQQQWQHAFGMSSLWVFWTHLNVSEGYREYHDTCPFVFPNDPSQCADGKEGVGVNTYRAGFIYLFAGISGAGPNLTVKSFDQGMWDYPPTGGTPAVPLIHFTKDSPVAIKDMVEVYWDPNQQGNDEVGKNGSGFLMKVNGGKRYQIGQWPTSDPQVFSKAVGPTGTTDDPYVHGQHFDDPAPRSPSEKCLSCSGT